MALAGRSRFSASRAAAGVLAVAAVMSAGACRRVRLSRGDAASVVVVAPRADVSAARGLAEHEPNDSPAKAQLLVLDPERSVIDVEGDLAGEAAGCGKDVDVFKLLIPGAGPSQDTPRPPLDSASPEDPRFLSRRLTAAIASEDGVSASLQVLDDALKVLGAVSSAGGEATGIPNLAAHPGRLYYFRVRASSKSGKAGGAETVCKYKLSLQLGSFGSGDEREPNDSMDTAEPVAMVGMAELAGYHGWPRDQDYYRIPAPEIASALGVVLDGVEGVVPGLQVLDGGGARLALAKGRKNEPLALHNVRVSAGGVDAGATSRFVYVVVRNEAGQNRTQRYILRLAWGAIDPGVEVEPNDTPSIATPVGDGTMSGFLPAGDLDCFVYDRRDSREVSVDVAFPARVRGKVELVRMGKAEVVASAEAKKAHQPVALPKAANLGEPLLIRIAAAKGDGNASQPYLLRITSVPSTGRGAGPGPGSAATPSVRLPLNLDRKLAE